MIDGHGPGSSGRMLNIETGKAAGVAATLMRLAACFKPYWPALLLVGLMIVGGTWTQVTAPLLIGQTVDCYLAPQLQTGDAGAMQSNCSQWLAGDISNGDAFLQGLGKMVLLIASLYIAGALINSLQFYLIGRVGQQMLKTLRVDIFKHLQQLPLRFYDENEAGNIMSRVTNDIETIQQTITFALVNITGGVLLIAWMLYIMLARSLLYALISMSIVPLMAITTIWISNRARRAFRRTRQEIGRLNANLQESISGVRQVQAFNREEANQASFRLDNAANRDANIQAVAYTAALSPALEGLGYLAIAVTSVSGGLILLNGGHFYGATLTLGLVITFLNYTQRFNQPIQQIAMMWTNIQSAVAGAERIFNLLDIPPHIQSSGGSMVMPPMQGKIEFENVSSSYIPGVPVLKDISFSVQPGQTVAIVGQTGAGKTTITNLMPRFYDIDSGCIRIDGIDITMVCPDSLRNQIGIVLQDTFLFSDSVMNNIRFGRPEATDDDVMAAARLAYADDFIQHLPQGYQTILGEHGSGLSQGQRQLLAIARAALCRPRILILDEATSNVDTRTERRIQQALEILMKGRTSFVIAHRLSTIRNADHVLVLADGCIAEQGKHDDLMSKRGVYYELSMRQLNKTQEPKSGLQAAHQTI